MQRDKSDIKKIWYFLEQLTELQNAQDTFKVFC